MITIEFKEWITMQYKLLLRHFPSDTPREEILIRLAKLTEEVGELADEVLSSLKHQRKEKLEQKTDDALASEFADVFITTSLLAEAMGVDISQALHNRLPKINERFEKIEADAASIT